MKKLHTQLLRDDQGRYRIGPAKNQDDPIMCVGSGQLNSMSPGMWEVFKKAQEAQDAFQAALAELFCSDQFPFEENANVDLPDTAAQDSASKPNSPAVSG